MVSGGEFPFFTSSKGRACFSFFNLVSRIRPYEKKVILSRYSGKLTGQCSSILSPSFQNILNLPSPAWHQVATTYITWQRDLQGAFGMRVESVVSVQSVTTNNQVLFCSDCVSLALFIFTATPPSSCYCILYFTELRYTRELSLRHTDNMWWNPDFSQWSVTVPVFHQEASSHHSHGDFIHFWTRIKREVGIKGTDDSFLPQNWVMNLEGIIKCEKKKKPCMSLI